MPSFSEKQQAAIRSLTESANMRRAAERAGVARGTLWKWTKDPEFKAAVDKARADIFDHAVETLRTATGRAAAVLVEQMQSDDPTIALRAARAVFSEYASASDRTQVEAKISELEAQLATLKATKGRR